MLERGRAFTRPLRVAHADLFSEFVCQREQEATHVGFIAEAYKVGAFLAGACLKAFAVLEVLSDNIHKGCDNFSVCYALVLAADVLHSAEAYGVIILDRDTAAACGERSELNALAQLVDSVHRQCVVQVINLLLRIVLHDFVLLRHIVIIVYWIANIHTCLNILIIRRVV